MLPELHLYDGTYYAYRMYHGMPKLTNSKKEPVGMLVGLSAVIHKLRTQGPKHMLWLFDEGKCEWREKIVETYKANRVSTPEVYAQLPRLRAILEGYGVPHLSSLGVEADDLIGMYGRAFGTKCSKIIIHTNDKDMAQLVRKNVVVETYEGKVLGTKQVVAKYGLGPCHFASYLALVGDAVDGYPKVCTPRVAKELIASYGSIKDMFELRENRSKWRKVDDMHKQIIDNPQLALNYRVSKIRTLSKSKLAHSSLNGLKTTRINTHGLDVIFSKWELKAAVKRVANLPSANTLWG